jgi:peptide/nickel transport system ATP-binding protein
VTALSIMGLIPKQSGRVSGGQIEFEGRDLLTLPERELRKYRGNRLSMVFQEPMSALNPVLTAGAQVAEVFRLHRGASRSEAFAQAVRMLEKVRIPDAEARARNYPHELSGGMRQRVMIAMALACNPAVLIADEPTTALDVTIQAQMLRLMQGLQHELGTALLFITHDLGVVAELADEVAVMYAGQIVERAPVDKLFDRPLHPYTRGLLAARPPLQGERTRRLRTIPGMVPALNALPPACRFAPRCPLVEPICNERMPLLMHPGSASRLVACHVAQREATHV